jgi:hypothetical protein
MNPETQALVDQVTATKGVESSAKVLIDGIAARLVTAAGTQDWTQVTAVTADLKASSDALASSVAANP